MRPEDKRLIWLILVACWLAIAAWAVMTLRPYLFPRSFSPALAPEGEFHRVEDLIPPFTLRLDDGSEVRLGGIAAPADPAAAGRAIARIRQLAPPGAEVYVQRPLGLAPAPGSSYTASVWLPPARADHTPPFPYGEARLIAQVLVQEGFVPVDEEQPYMYRNELLNIEHDAQRHHRGIWAEP
jgi:hypothetical protein